MTRTMYDSTNPFDIPTSAGMVAGYVDGIYAWTQAGWDRFPHAVKVRIAVSPLTVTDGHVLDVETGDATPAQSVGWVQTRRVRGFDPSVYCSYSTWLSVKGAFQSAGVAEPHYWIAAYGNPPDPTIFTGAIAHQYADPVHSGGHYDLSSVADFWPGVDSAFRGGGGPLGVDVNASEKYALVRIANAAFAGPDHIPTDAQIVAVGDTILDDGSNTDTVIRAIQADSGSKPWEQIATDLKAGKYNPIPGPAGAPGPAGPAGPQGPAGASPTHATLGPVTLTLS